MIYTVLILFACSQLVTSRSLLTTVRKSIEDKVVAEQAAVFVQQLLKTQNITSIEKLTKVMSKLIPNAVSISPLNSSSSNDTLSSTDDNPASEYTPDGFSLPSIDAKGANVNVQVVIAPKTGSGGCCSCILSSSAPNQINQIVHQILKLAAPSAEVLASLPTTEAEAQASSPPPTLLDKLGIKTKRQRTAETKQAANNTAYLINALFPSVKEAVKGRRMQQQSTAGSMDLNLKEILSSLLTSSDGESQSGSLNLNPISITTKQAPSESSTSLGSLRDRSRKCCQCNN